MRLWIVEDDEKTARALAAGLECSGFSVATVHMFIQPRTGEKPLVAALTTPVDAAERSS